MTNVFSLIEGALYTKLTGNANLQSLVAAKIFDTKATQPTADPYVLFQFTGGGDENETPRREVNVVYRVEGVSRVQATARTIAGYIDEALHDQALTLTGWSNYRMMQENYFNLEQIIEGIQFYRKGGFYRIMLSKSD